MDDNFIMRNDQLAACESTRDSLEESSEISSDAFSSSFRPNYNHFNHITQHIQNNNNKITIIIKHQNDPTVQRNQFAPQVIYIQPAAASQPNLVSSTINQSNDDLQFPEIYNSLDDIDSDEHYQFYGERAVDVPEDFKRNSYLVLNFNDAANRKLKRRICTPTRNLIPLDDINYALPNQINDNNSRNKAVFIQVSSIARVVICTLHKTAKKSMKPIKRF